MKQLLLNQVQLFNKSKTIAMLAVYLSGQDHDLDDCQGKLQLASLKNSDMVCFGKLMKHLAFAELEHRKEKPIPFVYNKFIRGNEWLPKVALFNSPDNGLLPTKYYLSFRPKSDYTYTRISSKGESFKNINFKSKDCTYKFYSDSEGKDYAIERCLSNAPEPTRPDEVFASGLVGGFPDQTDWQSSRFFRFGYFTDLTPSAYCKKIKEAFETEKLKYNIVIDAVV